MTWSLNAQFINIAFKSVSNIREQSYGETSALQVLEGGYLNFVKKTANESSNLSFKVTLLISVREVPNKVLAGPIFVLVVVYSWILSKLHTSA